jgi:hypothetical protein
VELLFPDGAATKVRTDLLEKRAHSTILGSQGGAHSTILGSQGGAHSTILGSQGGAVPSTPEQASVFPLSLRLSMRKLPGALLQIYGSICTLIFAY